MQYACPCVLLLTCGCARHRPVGVGVAGSPPLAPAVVTRDLREALPQDYLRIIFVSPGTTVTSLSRPGSIRAFMTASRFFSPPVSLEEYPTYLGLIDEDASVLIAMRCKPPQPDKVDALMATWPNVFAAIERDVPAKPNGCSGEVKDPDGQARCFAMGYRDTASSTVPTTLAQTLSYAAVAFDAEHAVLAQWLRAKYGVFPSFSGLGFSVKDSYTLSSNPMNSEQIMSRLISPEYLLKNVSLKDAGCRCISVPPYAGRAKDLLDPGFVDSAGGDGVCKQVERLNTVPQ